MNTPRTIILLHLTLDTSQQPSLEIYKEKHLTKSRSRTTPVAPACQCLERYCLERDLQAEIKQRDLRLP
ncbi:hypothetical protein J6590_011156 [Homalodisca vitripennis]|nr:hypothetical protein J6590_011156 [Homalodisca vitripennis]